MLIHCPHGRCPVGDHSGPALAASHPDSAAESCLQLLPLPHHRMSDDGAGLRQTDVHSLEPEDMDALTMEASALAMGARGSPYTVGRPDLTRYEVVMRVNHGQSPESQQIRASQKTAKRGKPAAQGVGRQVRGGQGPAADSDQLQGNGAPRGLPGDIEFHASRKDGFWTRRCRKRIGASHTAIRSMSTWLPRLRAEPHALPPEVHAKVMGWSDLKLA